MDTSTIIVGDFNTLLFIIDQIDKILVKTYKI